MRHKRPRGDDRWRKIVREYLRLYGEWAHTFKPSAQERELRSLMREQVAELAKLCTPDFRVVACEWLTQRTGKDMRHYQELSHTEQQTVESMRLSAFGQMLLLLPERPIGDSEDVRAVLINLARWCLENTRPGTRPPSAPAPQTESDPEPPTSTDDSSTEQQIQEQTPARPARDQHDQPDQDGQQKTLLPYSASGLC